MSAGRLTAERIAEIAANLHQGFLRPDDYFARVIDELLGQDAEIKRMRQGVENNLWPALREKDAQIAALEEEHAQAMFDAGAFPGDLLREKNALIASLRDENDKLITANRAHAAEIADLREIQEWSTRAMRVATETLRDVEKRL